MTDNREIPATTSKSSNSHDAIHATSTHRRSKNKIEARMLTRYERKIIARRLFRSMENATGSAVSSPFRGVALQQHVKHSSPTDTTRLPDQSVRVAYAAPIHHKEYTNQAKLNSLVRFREAVSVIEIPSHRSYSREARKNLWNSTKQIRLDAARNKCEFAADGRTWQTCKEEDEMLALTRTGELVHPVTYLSIQRYNQRRVFQKLREANKKELPSEQSATPSHAAVTVTDTTGDSVKHAGIFFSRQWHGTGSATRASSVYLSSQDHQPLSTMMTHQPNPMLVPKHPFEGRSKKTVPIKVPKSRKRVIRKRSSLLVRAGKRAVLLG